MTDKQYYELYSTSCTAAQTALFNEYFNYVYSIVYNKIRGCSTKEDIEECVSDVFSAVFVKYERDGFAAGDLKGLIGTIAKNKAISFYRALTVRNRHTTELDDASELSDSSCIMENTERRELQGVLLSCVNALGEPDSTMVIQKYYYNMNSSQIAKSLSMTPAAVRVRCGRAIKKLKEMLSERGFGLKECNL